MVFRMVAADLLYNIATLSFSPSLQLLSPARLLTYRALRPSSRVRKYLTNQTEVITLECTSVYLVVSGCHGGVATGDFKSAHDYVRQVAIISLVVALWFLWIAECLM